MLVRGDFITPYYYGAPLFHIPALSYWLIIASYKLFGVSLFSARIPAVVAGACLVSITALAAGRLIGPWAAVFAALVLGTGFGFAQMASTSMCDMLLALFDVVALVSLFCILEFAQSNQNKQRQKRQKTICAILAGCAIGAGILTKGPVALVLPAGCVLSYAILCSIACRSKDSLVTLLKQLPQIALPALLIGVPWYLVAYQANGVAALSAFLIHENLQRFTGSEKMLGVFRYSDCFAFTHPQYYMIKNLFAGFLPWSPLLVGGLFLAVRQYLRSAPSVESPPGVGSASGNSAKAFLLATPLRRALFLCAFWVIFHTAFFSFARSNWSYYNLPVYPACALLITATIWSLPIWWQKAAIWLGSLVLAGTIVFHMAVTPARAKLDSSAPAISDSLAHIPAGARVLIHFDFVMQYLLSDLIALKSNRIPSMVHVGAIEKAVKSDEHCYVLIAEDQVATLTPAVRQALRHVSTFPFQRTDYAALKDRVERNVPVNLMVLTNR